MKIAKAVRALHAEGEAQYRRLGADVEARLKPRVEERGWFFLGRVKQLESFALKLETGRIVDPRHAEDFYACTIVVRTVAEIAVAEELVGSVYGLRQRRPAEDGQTRKSASSFVFDDLRLYVEQPESTTGRDTDLDGLVFEIQVKTILQYAWGVATHDLTYKADSVSWSRERIAFQVKAMLEHAEIAIAEAGALSNAPAIAKIDRATADITHILETLAAIWSDDQLPTDRKRLAETIFAALRMCRLEANGFADIIEAEQFRVGLVPADLSPYAFTIQALANNSGVRFKKHLLDARNRTSVFVHDGMELPSWMDAAHPRIIRA